MQPASEGGARAESWRAQTKTHGDRRIVLCCHCGEALGPRALRARGRSSAPRDPRPPRWHRRACPPRLLRHTPGCGARLAQARLRRARLGQGTAPGRRGQTLAMGYAAPSRSPRGHGNPPWERSRRAAEGGRHGARRQPVGPAAGGSAAGPSLAQQPAAPQREVASL